MSKNKTSLLWNQTWLSGAFGALTVIVCALWFANFNLLNNGVKVLGFTVAENRNSAILFALVLSAAIAFAVEFVRQYKVSGNSLFEYPPVKNLNFYADCVVYYLQTIAVLFVVKMFFQTAGEYGFSHRAAFYQPWFFSLQVFTQAYYFLGLPYIVLTRSLKFSESADRSRYGSLVGKIGISMLSRIPFFKDYRPKFDSTDKQIFLSLLLQLFFLPLIVVFFYQIFPHLIESINYLGNGMPHSFTAAAFKHATFNEDIARMAISVLFSAHLVVIFASYAMPSRWIQANKQITDSTLFSWLVCLLVFPPFIHLLITSWADAMIGPAMQEPPRLITQIGNQSLVTACIFGMIGFYILYVVSTLTLGMSYANLCYRKLIQNGIFSIVRHPTYSAKMLAISCFVIPLIILNASNDNWEHAASLAGGLAIGYLLFYVRALREEHLLRQHCDYDEYCKKVPYRFIPKLF